VIDAAVAERADVVRSLPVAIAGSIPRTIAPPEAELKTGQKLDLGAATPGSTASPKIGGCRPKVKLIKERRVQNSSYLTNNQLRLDFGP